MLYLGPDLCWHGGGILPPGLPVHAPVLLLQLDLGSVVDGLGSVVAH